MNKRGFWPLVIGLGIAIPAAILLLAGGISAFKVNSIFSSIPTPFWFAIIGLFFLVMLRGGKK